MIVAHKVADFDGWKAGFDAGRQSPPALRSFFADDDLRASMKELGMTSEP